MARINQSWREQRKAVVAFDADGGQHSFISVWHAGKTVSELKGCEQSTARKEIRKAIKTKCWRYGCLWSWKTE